MYIKQSCFGDYHLQYAKSVNECVQILLVLSVKQEDHGTVALYSSPFNYNIVIVG